MSKGWMVNFQMRRIEYVEAKQDPTKNPTGYAIWKGPSRTYKLHASQVYGTEYQALAELERRMAERFKKLEAQVKKYSLELFDVRHTLDSFRPARTNEDSWNCKYCRKTETCNAHSSQGVAGSLPKLYDPH